MRDGLGAIFSPGPQGPPFRLFGPHHLAALAATGVCLAATVAAGRRLGPVGRRRARVALAGALWSQEVAYHVWRARSGTWDLKHMLPLHLCSVLVWGEGLALLRPSGLCDDVCWYWGVAGVPQALLTPDLGGFGYPHFRFLQFFVSHGLVLAVPLWMTFVEGRRPSPGGALRAFGLLLTQAGVAHLVNRRLGSNYMFVSGPLDTPSVLDKLPPWPRYLPVLFVLAAAGFAAAHAPLAVADALRRGRPRRR